MKRGVVKCFVLFLIFLLFLTFPTSAKTLNTQSERFVSASDTLSQLQPPFVLIAAFLYDAFGDIVSDTRISKIFDPFFGESFRITGDAIQLPQAFVNTVMPTQTGQTITVNSGGNLQTALNSAQPGDTIVLQAGATFSGNFVLPAKLNPQNKWIIIKTSAENSLPPQGQRVNVIDAPNMAKIVTPNSGSAISTANGANGYRLIGLEIASSPGMLNNDLVLLGSWSQQNSSMPYNLVIDRSWIHGCATCSIKNAVALHAGSTAIIDSRIEDVHWVGVESHAIGGGNGLGPWKIENNFVDAASINMLVGGAAHTVTGHPSDIVVKGNYFYKSPIYKGKGYAVKNNFELKVGERVLVEGNIMENSWVDGQVGTGVVLKNPDSNPSVPFSRPGDVTKDVTFRYNIIKNVAGGIGFSEGITDTIMEHNIIEYGPGNGVNGRLISITGGPGPTAKLPSMQNIVINHNTGFTPNSAIIFSNPDAVTSGFVVTNNIFDKGQYGVIGTGTGIAGTTTLNSAAPGWVFSENILFGSSVTNYPAGNYYIPLTSVGFANYNGGIGGDYTLLPGSTYKNRATDGTDLGADITMVKQMTSGVVLGVWGSCTDTSWSPAINTRCGVFTQVSNCGNTRTVIGTISCSGSTPFCSPTNICVQCTQSSQCATGQTCTNNVCITPPPAPVGGLVAAYNFSEGNGTTTADYSGNNRAGNLAGTTWTTGKTGSGLSFSSSQNSQVSVADFATPSSITMEVWIYPTAVSGIDRIVLSKEITEYEFRIIGSISRLQAGLGHARIRDTLDYSNAANLNRWYHYAYTYDMSTGESKLYRDGVFIDSSTVSPGVIDNSNDLIIGRSPTLGSSFEGIIDDVRIWNYARTQSQIQADMGAVPIPPCVDTIWTPSPIGLCGNVTQTSDCGNTRVVQGTVQCTITQTCVDNSCTSIPPTCGNSVVEVGEQCDDGNLVNTDACTNSCMNAVCGDGYVRTGVEQCDDSNTQSGDGCSSTCQIEQQQGQCKLNFAGWSETQLIKGQTVNLNVQGENCNGKTVSFVIWEDDLIGDDPVETNPVSVVFSEGKATGKWTAEWQNDGGPFGKDPEYYFLATVSGASGSPISSGMGSDQLLKVTSGSSGSPKGRKN